MPGMDEALLKRLMPIFREEARENIAGIGARLGELGGGGRSASVEIAFRQAHSLKAAARAVGQDAIERVCQSLESAFDQLKRTEAAPEPALLAAMLLASDTLDDLLASLDAAPDRQRDERASEVAAKIDALLVRPEDGPEPSFGQPAVDQPAEPALSEATPEPAAAPPPAPPSALESDVPAPAPSGALPPPMPVPSSPPRPRTSPGPAVETVRLPVHRLDALLLQAEEMLTEKLAARQLAADIRAALAEFRQWRGVLRQLRGIGDEIRFPQDFAALTERFARSMDERLAGIDRMAAMEARGLGAKVDRLLHDMKQALTVPCGSMLQLFPHAVRQLARDQGKDLAFEMEGVEIEMDRHILDELKDPLLHIVRNCVDHGVEKPRERVAAGKVPRATIRLRVATVDGSHAEFTIEDDGSGISLEKVAAAAVKHGVLPPDQAAARLAAADTELVQLIFQSGVSTSPMITDLSGRGLGLAIVREKVERLGGTVSVQSSEGRGTVFRLLVPLTLATYRGILIRLGDRRFVLPTLGVERVIGVERTDLSTIENRPVLDADGASIPLVPLREALDLPATGGARGALSGRLNVVVLGSAARRVAFEVDAVEGDQEILVKPLGPYLVRVRNVQGATVLADGTIAPILNVHDLLLSAARVIRTASAGPVPRHDAAQSAGRILLVEDSITARGLLRNILEAAGYHVTIAVDGMDAWTTLNLQPFDLVVSDVEMPRMNGFELTTRIRAVSALKDLPVILVTALDTTADRERGVDAGANAYITKGGFDQQRLLDTVRRFA